MSFSRSLATKCVSLNNEPCIARPALINLNPREFNYYPFIISLGKCNGSFNVVDDSSTKVYVPNKTKDISVKVFSMITIYEAKTLVKHISFDCKCKFNSATCNSNQKWNNDTCQCECKSTVHAKNIAHVMYPSTCICENSKLCVMKS